MNIQSRQKHIRTDDANWQWSNEELEEYVRGNYGKGVIREDRVLGSVAVATLAVYAREHSLFHTLSHAAHVGAGGVPRGSAILAPLMLDRDKGGKITVSDLGETNIVGTRKVMEELAHGRLGMWQSHQDEMTISNPDWKGAFQRAGSLARVGGLDIRHLQSESQEAIAMEYVAESITTDTDEYLEIMKGICDGLEPRGVLYMTYMIGSHGYLVGNDVRPAVPVTVDYVSEVLRINSMDIIFNGGTDASRQARIAGDPHSDDYVGMGVAIAVRK
jgi:hypothetical protein